MHSQFLYRSMTASFLICFFCLVYLNLYTLHPIFSLFFTFFFIMLGILYPYFFISTFYNGSFMPILVSGVIGVSTPGILLLISRVYGFLFLITQVNINWVLLFKDIKIKLLGIFALYTILSGLIIGDSIKSISFIYYSFFVTIAGFLIVVEKKFFKNFVVISSILGIFYILVALHFKDATFPLQEFLAISGLNVLFDKLVESGRYSFVNNPIWYGRIITSSLFILFFLIHVINTKKYRYKLVLYTIFFIIIVPLGIYLSIESRSIGPVIQFFLASLLYPIVRFFPRFLYLFVAGVLLTPFIVGSILYKPLTDLLSFDRGILSRLELFKEAFNSLKNNILFGVGIGNFSASNIYGSFNYPHNIVLEVSSEMGIIGVIILAMILFYVAKSLISELKQSHDTTKLSFVIVLFVFSLLGASISGDINGNHLLWLSIGMLVGINYIHSKENQQQ